MLDLILKDISDPVLRENFFRIQRYVQDNVLLGTDFKFIEADVPQSSFAYPIPHGLNFVPTDIIPLSSEGDFNYFFKTDESDRTNIYVAAHGPVRLRFLAGKINQTGRRALKDSKLPFVAPNIGQSTGTLSGAGSDGWAFIQDSARTYNSPFQISAGVRTLLPNDGAGTLTNYTNAPANASSWWDKTNFKFWPSKLGEFYTFKLNFWLVPLINNKNFLVETDIGTGNAPFALTQLLTKGAGQTNKFSFAIPMAIGPSAFSNGVAFKITSDCDAQVSNINLTIIRDYHL